MSEYREKENRLEEILRGYGSVGVAFSGGVDSTYLLAKAQEVLGEGAVALTADGPFFPRSEQAEARAFCESRGIRQEILRADTLADETVRSNPPDRCYHCKRGIFSVLLARAEQLGLAAVADGSNVDDLGDYRPGMRAIRELGIRSPLREAGLAKEDIRKLSRAAGLPTWDKPSFACLASRIPYGDEISEDKLRMVGRAERVLFDLGLSQVRVRIHGDLARIEALPEEMDLLARPEIRAQIHTALRAIGFAYVTMDLAGYRTGSLNEVLQSLQHKD